LENGLTELAGELFPDFGDFPSPCIIPQGSGHFLINHDLLVAFSFSPKFSKFFLVFCYKLKQAFVFTNPLDNSMSSQD
jgi:hypothetical protein